MKRTMTRRFYVGSKSISHSDGHSELLQTLSEAVNEGKSKVESGEREICYIVEVVRVIRRASNPVIVEETR